MGNTYLNQGEGRKRAGRATKATVTNSSGLPAFAVGDLVALRRYLILGVEGATIYASQAQRQEDEIAVLTRCLAADGKHGTQTAEAILAVATKRLAIKHDSVLHAIALVLSQGKGSVGQGSTANKRTLLARIHEWAHIGTDVLHLTQMVFKRRALSGAVRRALGAWYNGQDATQLAYQLVKYQQRDGFSQGDVLKLLHLAAPTVDHEAIYTWAIKGWGEIARRCAEDLDALQLIWARERVLEQPSNATFAAQHIRNFGLTHEMLPTEVKTSPEVWRALLETPGALPNTALLRNLATMTRLGVLTPLSDAERLVLYRLSGEAFVRKNHPFKILLGLHTYASGHSVKGSSTWTPNQNVVAALESAFYASMAMVEPTGLRLKLAIDTSGSMQGARLSDTTISAREAATAMAMVYARAERHIDMVGFADKLIPLNFSRVSSLTNAMTAVASGPSGMTDLGLPIKDAMRLGQVVDAFVLFTDSEHSVRNARDPMALLREYRQAFNPQAKLVVCAMTANEISVADPGDPNTLDIVGFDASSPEALRLFLTGQA